MVSSFRVNIIAVNITDQQRTTPPIEALVDIDSELTWLPADVLQSAGVGPVRTSSFQTATGQTISRPIGYAILRSEGFETIDEVVFAEPGDMSLLGVRTLEGFSVTVDSIGHRFVARASIVAAWRIHT